jgi:hypothetical protein
MSDVKMTPEQTAMIAAGVAVATTFAASSGNPATVAAVTAASGLLQGVLAAQATGADYTMADYTAAVAQFETLRAQGQALQVAAP